MDYAHNAAEPLMGAGGLVPFRSFIAKRVQYCVFRYLSPYKSALLGFAPDGFCLIDHLTAADVEPVLDRKSVV